MKTYIFGLILESADGESPHFILAIGHTKARSEDEARGIALRATMEKQPGCPVLYVAVTEFLPESAE